METQISDALAEKIAKQSFVFELHIQTPGLRKKIPSDQFLTRSGNNSHVFPERLSISKALIDKSALKDVHKEIRNFVHYIRQISLPGGVLTVGHGQYLIPLILVEELKTKLNKFITNHEEMVKSFLESYPQFVEDSKLALGAEFNQNEYPSIEALRNSFGISYKFVSNAIPEEFEKISKKLYEEEKARVLAECSTAANLIKDSLREKFADLVSHMVSRLMPDEKTGKKKIFRASSMKNIEEFSELFKSLNLTDDTELSVMIEKATKLLNGVDPQAIRTDEEIRNQLTSDFNDLKTQLDTMVVKKSRKLTLEESPVLEDSNPNPFE